MFDPSFLLWSLAVLMIVIMLPALFCSKCWKRAMEKLSKDEGNIRLLGIIMFLMAFFFLSTEWRLSVQGWNLLIPILGWLTFIKGLFAFWWPGMFMKIYKSWVKIAPSMITFWSIFGLLIAAALIYIAQNLL